MESDSPLAQTESLLDSNDTSRYDLMRTPLTAGDLSLKDSSIMQSKEVPLEAMFSGQTVILAKEESAVTTSQGSPREKFDGFIGDFRGLNDLSSDDDEMISIEDTYREVG